MEAKTVLQTLFDKQNLNYEQSQQVMRGIMHGDYTNVQIAGILTALRMKGETAEEIAGLSQAMQELTFPIEQAPDAIDVVGTGGASFKTFNVSSMSGLVLGSMGIKVAKHGNRSNTSKCGSADFLEAIGINLRLDPQRASNVLNSQNFVYLFAPFYHRSMKHAIIARKELQARTVFNILGPLTNPMRVQQSLIGVFDPDLLELVADSLNQRGHARAAVIHNEHGADEILNNGITKVVEINSGKKDSYELTVEDFGLKELPKVELRNRTVKGSLRQALKIMDGEITPLAEFCAINSAMAMRLAGKGQDLEDNTEQILNHIATGEIRQYVNQLVYATGGKLAVELSQAA